MTALSDLELQRARWRRARATGHLLDADDSAFAKSSLARRLDKVAARMLLLPSDPELVSAPTDEALLDRLDEAAKEWGSAHHVGNLWGFGKTATADGACLFGYDNSSAGPWNGYLCLRSDGGLDVGLGTRVFWARDDDKWFGLSAIVARVWCALEVHAAISTLQRADPGEVTLALVDTEGSVLGGLAEGWAEPFAGFGSEPSRCRNANVLLRLELEALPTAENAQDLAFRLGALIENAWGYTLCRFIARKGPLEGQFDWRPAAC